MKDDWQHFFFSVKTQELWSFFFPLVAAEARRRQKTATASVSSHIVNESGLAATTLKREKKNKRNEANQLKH